jgi:hypothetical protein
MCEALDGERWREPKMEKCMAISLRKGKMGPSVKYKHPISIKMSDSYWRQGIDKLDYKVRDSLLCRVP